MKVQPADFRCPYCRSGNVDVTDNSDVEWGNNDQGTIFEEITCLDCKKRFYSNTRVEVVFRELTFNFCCPYCSDSNEVTLHDDSDPNVKWYFCESCNKEFAVHPEEWYEEKQFLPGGVNDESQC